jgi:carbon monoxide dehydrogenase subunit G
MTLVARSVHIDVPPPLVWEIVMNPRRLGEWVTIHRSLRSFSDGPPAKGMVMEQTLHLRGADFTVTWRLTECEAPHRAVWQGRGPARSHAEIEYSLQPRGGGTDFAYSNDFTSPFGLLGDIAGRALVRHTAQREAERSLARLKALAEQATAAPQPGGP